MSWITIKVDFHNHALVGVKHKRADRLHFAGRETAIRMSCNIRIWQALSVLVDVQVDPKIEHPLLCRSRWKCLNVDRIDLVGHGLTIRHPRFGEEGDGFQVRAIIGG